MSRARLQQRRDALNSWPALSQFMTKVAHGSDERGVKDDVDAAIAAMTHHERVELTREWWRWNATVGAKDDIRFAIEALDSNILFDEAEHARLFMNQLYDKLVVSVRQSDGKDWKP